MTTKSDDTPVEVGDTFVAHFDVDVLKAEKTSDDIGHVEAIVSAYNVDYQMGFLAKHRIHDGAFKTSIAEQPVVPIFWQHNWDFSEQPPIGTGEASEVVAPKRGLKVSADMFLDSEAGRSVFNAIKAGALRQWSIGYRVTKYEVEEQEDGFSLIHINEAELLEASSVLRGANPETDTLKVASEAAQIELNESILAWMKTVNKRMDATDERLDSLVTEQEALQDAHEVLLDSYVPMDLQELEPAPLREVELVIKDNEADNSGEVVEPADGGDSKEPEVAATEAPEAPTSPATVLGEKLIEDRQRRRGLTAAMLESRLAEPEPEKEAADSGESVDLDSLQEATREKVIARRKEHVNRLAIGMAEADDEPNTREDIGAVERVMRCTNKVENLWDSVEQRTDAESAAARERERAAARRREETDRLIAEAEAEAQEESTREDIAALERVMRCTNKIKHMWQSLELRTDAESLAERERQM